MARRAALIVLAATFLAPAIAAAAVQDTPMTLEQLKREYPRMSPIHIAKCDWDGDGLYTHTEQICVANIYHALYRDER